MASPTHDRWDEDDDELLQHMIAHYNPLLLTDFAELQESNANSVSLSSNVEPSLDVLPFPELIINSELNADIDSQLQAASQDVNAFAAPWSTLHNSNNELCSDVTVDFPLDDVDAHTSDLLPSNKQDEPNKQDACTIMENPVISDANLHCCDNLGGHSCDGSKTIPHNLVHFSCNVSKDGYASMPSKTLNFVSLARDKRRKLNISSFIKPTSSIEEVHLIDCASAEDDGGNCKKSSKNLAYERQRRRKINDSLYALRSIVPKITKMDKASVVSDAVDYVQSLQKQIYEVSEEIQALQSWESIISQNILSRVPTLTPSSRKEVEYKILEVNVTKVENAIYQLQITCSNGKGVIANLTKAVEMLGIDIVNAKLITIDDHILNTIFIEARKGMGLEPKDLRDLVLRVSLMFGLGLAKG